MKNTKNCFTGGQTSLVGSVSRDFFLYIIFSFISGGENYPKNTQFSKKSLTFAKNFWKIFWFIFKHFSYKILEFCQKGLILQDFGILKRKLGKLKKKFSQNWNKNATVGLIKQFFVFVFCFSFLLCIIHHSKVRN